LVFGKLAAFAFHGAIRQQTEIRRNETAQKVVADTRTSAENFTALKKLLSAKGLDEKITQAD
jgi:hypothetical protein